MNTQQLSRFLGWFSVGLGLAELVAPRKVSRVIGVDEDKHRALLPLLGVREITSGVGILTQQRPVGWLWSRVAGDIMDLSFLGAALRSERGDRGRVQAALASVAVISVLDLICSAQMTRESAADANTYAEPKSRAGTASVHKSITIDRTPEELYAYWRDFDNLPRFMYHLESVTSLGDTRSQWIAKGPLGTHVEWEAEITEDRPGELIAWRSLPGSTVETDGTVRFERATGNRGTIVRVDLNYRPPAGMVGATIAKLLGEAPEKQVPTDLARFKQLLETGEIARTEGQAAGRARSTSRKYDDFVRV